MTNENNINQFTPNTPKTYEVRYLEQSNLSIIASYLGIKTAECSGSSNNAAKDVAKITSASAQEGSLYSNSEKKDTAVALAKAAEEQNQKGTYQHYKEGGEKKAGIYYTEGVNYSSNENPR